MGQKHMSRRTFVGVTAGALAATQAARGATANSRPVEPVKLDRPLTLDELHTPALTIDLDVFESNLAKMAQHGKSKGVGIRPHTKTHKCPIIAKRQIELGAIGVCAAKVSEAEAMVWAGVDNVLITSPVATKEKIDRVIAIAKQSDGVQMMIDNEGNASDFNDAAAAAGITLRVLVGLDTGTRRTGIALGAPAVKLVEHVVRNCPSLQFDGLQAYAGHVMHIKGFEKRKARSIETVGKCLETRSRIEAEGFDVGVFSGGGTGTFNIDSEIEGVTDLQVGSYVFMDGQYRECGDHDGEVFDHFEPSLFVMLTAISQPVPNMITLDGGIKAFATDARAPEFRNAKGIKYHFGGDEHGMCAITDENAKFSLGDKFELMVPHCDPTVNLYDYFHPYRDGKVEELWPVAARGGSQ